MPTETLAQLTQLVWDQVDNNQLEFSQANVTVALNEALYVTNILLGWNQVKISIPGNTQANTLQYPTPSGILIPLRLDIEGIAIERVSLRRLARQFPYWSVDATPPLGPIARWCMIGLSQFIIHPFDSIGGQLMEMTGIAPVVPLILQTQVMTCDQSWLDVLVAYAAIRVFLKETGQGWANAMKNMADLKKKIRTLSVWNDMKFDSLWYTWMQYPGGKG